MNEWLIRASQLAVGVINAMALLIIVMGTLIAFVSALRVMFVRVTGHARRAVWISYARWLVAGLTFQLAADIIESATAESWDAVGRLAAIAVIRTFLNYFLERDLAEVRERNTEPTERAAHEGV